MKILSWNIMAGGFKDYEDPSEVPHRLDDIKKVINYVDADIVCLIDTYRWSEIFTQKTILESFSEYKNAKIIDLKDERLQKIGHDNGIAILSKKKVEATTLWIYSRNCLKVMVEGVCIYGVYLDDESEDTRLKQVKAIINDININKHEKVLIAGDLNTVNKKDKNKKEALLRYLGSKANSQYIKKIMENIYKGEVIEFLETNGFKDLGTSGQETYPLSKIVNPLIRVDYFLGKNMEAPRYKVIKDAVVSGSSDHYPIVLEY